MHESCYGALMNGEPRKLVRPERFELPTKWFEATYSIQLSYGREAKHSTLVDWCWHTQFEQYSEMQGIFSRASRLRGRLFGGGVLTSRCGGIRRNGLPQSIGQ
jgi:hypothetical protein